MAWVIRKGKKLVRGLLYELENTKFVVKEYVEEFRTIAYAYWF